MVVGEGEMLVSGWITLTGDIDPLRDSTSCRLISWPYSAIDEMVFPILPPVQDCWEKPALIVL